jgi:hypothetical protein
MNGAATDMFARSQVATNRPKKHSNETSRRLGHGSNRDRPDNPLLPEANGMNGEGGIGLKFKMIEGRNGCPRPALHTLTDVQRFYGFFFNLKEA